MFEGFWGSGRAREGPPPVEIGRRDRGRRGRGGRLSKRSEFWGENAQHTQNKPRAAGRETAMTGTAISTQRRGERREGQETALRGGLLSACAAGRVAGLRGAPRGTNPWAGRDGEERYASAWERGRRSAQGRLFDHGDTENTENGGMGEGGIGR